MSEQHTAVIDPAIELTHTENDIRDLNAQLSWARRYRDLCLRVPGPVPLSVWEAHVAELRAGAGGE